MPAIATIRPMSQKNKYPIKCPKCSAEFEVDLYDSVNVEMDPSLRNELIYNRLNKADCPDCDLPFVIDKPLLYNDPVNDFMVYWLPLDGETIEEGQKRFRDFISNLNKTLPEDIYTPQVHLVFERVELIERIFMLEAELDERIINYMKYMIYTRNPEKVDPRNKNILFNAQDSTDEMLNFIIQDVQTRKIEGMLEYDRKVYASLDEMFDQDEQTADLLELFSGPYVSARQLVLNELAAENEANC
jgi:hypothetical protein